MFVKKSSSILALSFIHPRLIYIYYISIGCTVEYSNEVWNPLFDQGDYALEQGIALGLTDASTYGACVIYSTFCARARFNARRTSEIAAIWRDVWGSQASRLRFVLSTWTYQGANYAIEMLDFENTSSVVDAVGVTAYFGVDVAIDSSFASGRTADDVFDLLWASANSFPGNTELSAIVAAASARGVEVQTYEAGPGLVQSGAIEGWGTTAAVTDLLIEVNRDARMVYFQKKSKPLALLLPYLPLPPSSSFPPSFFPLAL